MIKDKIIGFVMALYPVLCIYASPVLIGSLGLLILYFIITPLLIWSNNKSISTNKLVGRYFLFFLYTVIITLLWRGIGGNDFISYIINSIVLLLLLHEQKYTVFFIKSYVFLAAIFSGFIIVQAVALYVFNVPIEGLLPIPKLIDDASSMGISDYMSVARISSVFLEPSHFALYVIPALAIVVWDIGIGFKYKKTFLILYIVGILVSTSGNGLVLLMILGLLYYYNRAKGRKFIIVTILAGLIVGTGLYVASQSEVIGYTTESLLTGSDSQGNSKSYYRVERGFELYTDLPAYLQVFGAGFRNAEKLCMEQVPGIITKYRSGNTNFEYFNTIASILIYFGIIGFFLFIYFISLVWRKTTCFGEKAIIVLMIAICFSSSVFNSETWFVFFCIISTITHSSKKKDSVYLNNKKNEAIIFDRSSARSV